MAIISNYEFQGDILENAYFRIKKIVLSVSDDEKFREDEDGHQHAYFEAGTENIAFVFVYTDKDTRDNFARPINQFGIFFDWEKGTDPWTSAYEALKNTEKIQQYKFTNVLEELDE